MKTKAWTLVGVLIVIASLFIFAGAAVADDASYTPSYSWYINHQSPYTISTAEDLAGFSQLVSSGKDLFKGKTVLLGADIQLNTDTEGKKDAMNDASLQSLKEFPSIGSSVDFAFEGTFDGQGHTISGLYSSEHGLFYTGNNCVIKNLNVVDATVVSTKETSAVLIGYCRGDCTIENCHVRDSTVYVTSLGTGDAGGIAGFVVGVHLKDCSVENTQIVCAYTDYAGGLVGYTDAASDFTGCVVKDSVIISEKSGVGGILGYGFTDVTFTDCSVDNTYVASTYDNYVGGIVGYGGSDAVFDGCLVSNSEIVAYKHSVGGIAGYVYHAVFSGSGSKVESTVIISEIEEYIGGFIGSTNKPVTVTLSSSEYCKLVNSRIVGGVSGYSMNLGPFIGRGTAENALGKIQISASIIGNPNAPATTDKTFFNLAGTSVDDNGWVISDKETDVFNGNTYGTPSKNWDVPTIKPTSQATQQSPAPLAGLIVGLGAAALFLARMRK